MSPPQTIDVAGQTFAPDAASLIGNQAVELTSRRDIPLWKEGVAGLADLHGKGEILSLAHPAASSSSGKLAVSVSGISPIESRPGLRFPGSLSFVEAWPDVSSDCCF